jgi:chromosome segregation ATPase
MPHGAVAQALRRRVQQSLALAARVTQLETEKAAASREAREASAALGKLQADAALLQQRGRAGGDAGAAALDALHAAEARAQAAEAALPPLRSALGAAERERDAALREGAELRADLERLLRERKGLESVKRVVLSALQPAQP